MSSTTTRDVLVFAGQGSNQYLASPSTAQNLRELLGEEHDATFQRFLDRCKDALHEELASLTPEEQSILGPEALEAFSDANSFLLPPQSFQSHALCETLNLYTYEILELLLLQCHQKNHHIIETSGICTGIIPAILAASYTSYLSKDFLQAAIEGFRLAFWIGLRASLHCRRVSGESWKESPSLLGVFGIKTEDVGEILRNYNVKVAPDARLRVSATFSDGNISIAGPGSSLDTFRHRISIDSVQCRWANVHAIYHGGDDMVYVMKEVLDDSKRRNITFPTWGSLHIPLRSVCDGTRWGPGAECQTSTLLEVALSSIFVDPVDWKEAGARLYQSSMSLLNSDSAASLRITGMGPGSRALVQSLKNLPAHPRLERVDNFTAALSQPRPDDIAVVGLSVNYPEGATQDSFWDVLKDGRSTVKEIPKSRFDMSQCYPDDPKKPRQGVNPKYGNFLDDPFAFDAAYFNISPREAKCIDPQQRLLLHGALEALDDAGYSPDSTPSFQKDTFGVYVGIATGDYVDNLRDDIDVYYSPGTLRAFLAGRISYAFKFKGPSMVIDTACSSSTVALYHACVALRSGECGAALVGGVNVISSPDMYCGLGRAHFLSPTGQCKPFDQAADGYCRSEGCGVVVLKKLSDAVREGDHIYGVIRGVGLNQCGTAKSITHPDHSTQASLVKTVLNMSRVTSDSINAVEAHGTGTQAGDFAELSSLSTIFGPRPPNDPLYLSSVKGHVGHSEAASGIAGLAKLLLMMEKKKIPPQGSYSKLNPRLEKLVAGRFHIPTKLQDWQKTSDSFVRRALLNNFGASGSNAALVVEEYAPRAVPRSQQALPVARPNRSHHVLNLSAKNESALKKQISNIASFIEENPSVTIEDLCYSANSRRQEYSPWKFSAVASSLTDLHQQLQSSEPAKVEAGQDRKVVFAFSGQGSVHAGMGADMIATVPLFESIVDECDKVLTENGFPAVKPFLKTKSMTLDAEVEVIISQCACFVLEYALATTWKTWGVKPDLVVGHSIGEFAAFAFAGALGLQQALLLVAKRAQMMTKSCQAQATGMLICKITAPEVASLLGNNNGEFAGVAVACMNSPQDFVLAGPLASLKQFSERCTADGRKSKLLPVPFGFHSAAMDPILDDLTALAAATPAKVPVLRMGSSLHGRVLEEGEVVEANYFVRHAREPVNFTGLVEMISQWGSGSDLTVMEIGPSPSTEGMFKQSMGSTKYAFVAALRPNQPSWMPTSSALRSLFLRNHTLNWRSVYEGTSAKFQKALPGYAVSPSTYFVPFRPPTAKVSQADIGDAQTQKPRFAFLTGAPESDGSVETFSTRMNQVSPWIKAHNVGGVPLCPASVYMEIVLQAAAHKGSIDSGMCIFEDITFGSPLVCSEDSESTELAVRTQLTAAGSADAYQYTTMSSSGQVLCSGRLRTSEKAKAASLDTISRKAVHAQRLKRSFGQGQGTETFTSRTIYDIIFPRVVQYSEPFLTLKHLTLDGSGLEGCGLFRLEALNETEGTYVSTPTFVDTLLHAAGFIANTHASTDTACICVNVEQAMVPSDSTDLYGKDLQVYCTIGDIGHSYVADAYALDPAGKLIAYVEGMCFKKMKLKPFQNHLARLVGNGVAAHAPQPQPVRKPVVAATAPAMEPPRRPASVHVDTHKINSLLRQVCGLDSNPASSTTLEELGMDSLLLIEFSELLRSQFQNISVSTHDVENCRTVGDLVKLIVESSDADDSSSTSESSLAPSNGTMDDPTHLGTEPITPPTPVTASEDSLIPLLKPLFVQICGLDPTAEYDGPLASLGVDSLLSIELIHEIRAKLGIEFDPHSEDISELSYTQLEELCVAKAMKKNQRGSAKQPSREQVSSSTEVKSSVTQKPSSNFPRVLQTAPGDDSHFYLFHDGSGLCTMYSRVASLEKNVYGVASLDAPVLQSADSGVRTMEDLATFYIQHTGMLTKPSVLLGGWSFGGVLAFEVARQLIRGGKTVEGVILVDSPAPVNHVGLPAEVISWVLSRGNDNGGRVVNTTAAQEARAKIGAQFTRHAGMLQNYQPKAFGSIPCVIIRCAEVIDTDKLCGVSYPWLSDLEAGNESIRLWEGLVGRKIPVLDLNCNHFDVFESRNIQETSAQLRNACGLIKEERKVVV